VARAQDPIAPLVLAAQELEDDIRRCEKAVEEASKLRLNSEKNIARAAQALKTASEDRERMAGKVNGLLAAINAAHARMQDAASRMEARALEIQARVARLETLQTGTAEIGTSLRELTELAKGLSDPKRILELMAPVEERVGKAFDEARAEGFEDIAHDIAGMREMLGSLRKKLQSL
jgi:chromosome segregation ATPase